MVSAILGAALLLAAGCASGQSGSSQASGSSDGSASSDASAATSQQGEEAQPAVTDYSKADSWFKIPTTAKDVDTFFIYPTVYMGFDEGDADFASLDNEEMLEGVQRMYDTQACVFEDSTNLYMPYYQQASMGAETRSAQDGSGSDALLSGVPYDDVCAALDYYFENYNEGHPFILAGHSQGSAIARLVLEGYFKEHPEYYERMVAAYVIGFAITQDLLDANPHLKFAQGETDTGVIVSWNTEGPENVEQNASNLVLSPNAISINPLNWKLDETYAPATENLGSRVQNEKTGEYEITDIGADAQLNLERGVVVTNADADPISMADAFGPQSFHNGDYPFFFENIKDNVAKRIAAYQALA